MYTQDNMMLDSWELGHSCSLYAALKTYVHVKVKQARWPKALQEVL